MSERCSQTFLGCLEEIKAIAEPVKMINSLQGMRGRRESEWEEGGEKDRWDREIYKQTAKAEDLNKRSVTSVLRASKQPSGLLFGCPERQQMGRKGGI